MRIQSFFESPYSRTIDIDPSDDDEFIPRITVHKVFRQDQWLPATVGWTSGNCISPTYTDLYAKALVEAAKLARRLDDRLDGKGLGEGLDDDKLSYQLCGI